MALWILRIGVFAGCAAAATGEVRGRPIESGEQHQETCICACCLVSAGLKQQRCRRDHRLSGLRLSLLPPYYYGLPQHQFCVASSERRRLCCEDGMRIGGFGQALCRCLLMFCFAGPGLAQSDPGLDGLNRTVVELYLAGRYAEGLPLAASAVALAERVKGPRDPAVATALNNYGEFLNRANRAPEAEEVYRRAVAIDEAAKSKGLSRDLNNLGSMLRSAHRLPEAEKLYVRALAVDERNVGPRHRDVARDLNNIALLLRDEGKETDAEPLQRRAITILEDLLRENPGKSSSELASALSNFAAGLPQDRAKEAESLYRRALELNEKELGTEHPNIAVNLNNLAEALAIVRKERRSRSSFPPGSQNRRKRPGSSEPHRGNSAQQPCQGFEGH